MLGSVTSENEQFRKFYTTTLCLTANLRSAAFERRNEDRKLGQFAAVYVNFQHRSLTVLAAHRTHHS